MIVEPWRYAMWKRLLEIVDGDLNLLMDARKHKQVTAESADLIVFSRRLKELWGALNLLEQRALRESRQEEQQ